MAETRVEPSLNCAVAGISTAALTGTLAGVVLWCFTLVTAKGVGPGANLADGLLWIATPGALFGAVSGTPSGVLVMCLSRAREAPWRSLPILLIGTTVGLVALGLPFGLLPGTSASVLVAPAMCVIGPTVGGIIAAKCLPPSRTAVASDLPIVFVAGFLAGLFGGSALLLLVIGPFLVQTVFAGLSWNVPSQHLVYVLWLASYPILGLVALVAAVNVIAGVGRTIWTGLGAGLASSLFLAGAFYLLALTR